MILCKKPCVLYDVDAAGILALVVLGVAAYLTAFVPLAEHESALRAIRADLVATRTATEQTGDRLARSEEDVELLRTHVAARVVEAPTAASITQFLSRAAALAGESNLQVLQVTPAPTKPTGDHLTSDIRMTARGHSLDFIRFLDRLARSNPYQTLERFSITRSEKATSGTCGLAWTIRLHILPPDFPVPTEGPS